MNATPGRCVHLTEELTRRIHAELLAECGGPGGLRDERLLASAVAAPQTSGGGESPYADLVEVAAAYLFYLCRNEPFHAGSRGAAMVAAIVFLRLNGLEPSPDGPGWERLVLDVAANRLDRDHTTARLRSLLKPPRKKP